MRALGPREPSKAARVYGPVPSRRLGLSLGVDLVPLKTCTYDCVYCQLGRTTKKTLCRQAFYPLEPALGEVAGRLQETRPDYVTVAGSGEPTLEVRLGDFLEALKGLSDVPVALLTNGSLFWDEEVQRAAALADLVVPSLDAGDEEFFQWVNRPEDGLPLEQVLDGLASFRSRYTGEIWLEVMVLAGMTETRGRLQALAAAAARVRPDRIQLNTPVRPGGQDFAVAMNPERLEALRPLFDPTAEVVAGSAPGEKTVGDAGANEELLLALLRRRPCTLEDLCNGLGLHPNEAVKLLAALFEAGEVHTSASAKGFFYVAAAPGERTAHGRGEGP